MIYISDNISTIVIVGGPAGTGKTTVGELMVSTINKDQTIELATFIEGDQLHPAQNIKKMSGGFPLTDDDRWGWLKLVAKAAHESAINSSKKSGISVVASCSALKKVYRDTIEQAVNTANQETGSNVKVIFAFLYADPQELIDRTNNRVGHFMAADMIDSQYRIMQVPEGSELLEKGGNCVAVSTDRKAAQMVHDEVIRKLSKYQE